MPMTIRSEAPADVAAIHALTAEAFRDVPHSSGTELLIVDGLRLAGQLTISLVAEADGVVVGHVAISPVSLSDGTVGWYGLGPISVLPARQGEGIGSQLMWRVLADLRQHGAAGCVVLGDPGYYGRFGFMPEPSVVLPGVPPEYFQAVAFQGTIPDATVSYHDAFNT